MAPQAIAQRPQQLIKLPLPDLAGGPGNTKSCALHKYFVGSMEEWPNFVEEARAAVQLAGITGDTPVISWTSRVAATEANINAEHVVVGAESGVQGRVQQNIGQAMGAICKSINIDMRFADYKAAAAPWIDRKVPDMICMTTAGHLRIVGEIKTPWVKAHKLARLFTLARAKVQQLFGQIAEYMMLANMRYGFLTTYEETIFFRQILSNGSWGLQYSKPIKSSTAAQEAPTGDYEDRVSVRECFLHLIQLADTNHIAGSPLPMAQWVRATPI
ncbi:hypothetical protein BDV32DRAFT_144337 [Aspergillus pseudonomiae]|uniref:Uncharacterized protein n=1 Tax=Aspergillus pseudonomiae TaxID=1506151 RepID=A0A5N6IHX6_9EURO|nr:uncharacterized protein BDV37DRAFT_286010 [Aspergillus pseudonomiae]KAB8265814.1 hypothetical protein BDV32DRAFT_144337 [Aspergillus pseudonomiae]KAE8401037.1 hypothetical protein BDV37DRAFT_286010 [Aspergillus pseudonomiae]